MTKQLIASASVICWLAACVGNIDDPPARTLATERVAQRFVRLSHTQWELTVVDLFHLPATTGLSATFAPDALGGKVFDNEQGALVVSPALFRNYQTAAETLAEQVTSDDTLFAGILPADLTGTPTQRARAFIASFGLRVFRRPLTAAESRARLALFERAAALYPALDAFVAGVRLSIAAFLQSPHFIYRAELSPNVTMIGTEPLNAWELASRLSYAIWNSMPDAALLEAAGSGELATPAGLHAQIKRMLDAPRARTTLRSFFDQLYDADQYLNLHKSTTLYPNFDPAVGAEMRGELDKFGEDVFLHDGSVRELLTSSRSFVTPRLAALYGLDPSGLSTPDADGFSRVDLDPTQRSGLLTRLGFLAWKGKESQPNTIQRGVFIVRRVLCQPLGDPPKAAVGAMLGMQATNRERVNALTGPGTCGAGCHATFINPAGFALEHFGALGEYRTQDGDQAIDSSASMTLPSGPLAFADAISFSTQLAQSEQVHACFSGYLLEFLLGRERVASDANLASRLAERSLSGVSIRELLTSVLESDALLYPRTTLEVL